MTEIEAFARLATMVSYDPDSGEMRWLPRPRSMFPSQWAFDRWSERNIGQMVGAVKANGYRIFTSFGRKYCTHRLAFFLIHGYTPETVDHKNRIQTDNRACNLRTATKSQNGLNTKSESKSKSGTRGVVQGGRKGTWYAQVRCHGRIHRSGPFADITQAATARDEIAARLIASGAARAQAKEGGK